MIETLERECSFLLVHDRDLLRIDDVVASKGGGKGGPPDKGGMPGGEGLDGMGGGEY